MSSATDKIVPVLNASHAPEKIESVFAKYHPDILLHAGMRKFETLYSVEYSNALRLNYSQTFSLAKISLKYRAKYFITLSSILDGYGESILCDSLKGLEQALIHFFSSTNTIYYIVRLAVIAENRGGIVSNIKDQVISNKQIVLPDIYSKGFVLLMSKTSAATFLLNTLAEILNNSNGNDYKCDAVRRYDLEELVTKLVLYYGFNDWNNINFKFNGNDLNTQKLFERRKTQNHEFKLLINNLNKNCKPGDI
jgi:FlaA1/EpsC-like NDP-sugar epimerase